MIRLQDIADMAGVSRTTGFQCDQWKYQESVSGNHR